MTDDSGNYWATLYDPLPGGSGFLPSILDFWTAVVRQGQVVLGDCTCEDACYRCMKHFRNQQYHGLFNRHEAISLLQDVEQTPVRSNDIPATIAPTEADYADEADSEAEEDFIRLLKARSYPRPDAAQYRVELAGGDYTVADYAYTDANVLIFIDGLSEGLHGDPAQSRRDNILRAKAKMAGYNVVAIPAQALHDEVMFGGLLEELSVYLGA
jgi:hypothetical protein